MRPVSQTEFAATGAYLSFNKLPRIFLLHSPQHLLYGLPNPVLAMA